MLSDRDRVIVAGHICLDIIPEILNPVGAVQSIFVPGSLTNVGPACITTGGAVANTGIALYRLGMNVSLMGKIGNDLFGHAIVDILKQNGPDLSDDMIIDQGEISSYSIVINPPQSDRMFLHSSGANDTFHADDLQEDRLKRGKLFHFGYPPLMRSMYENNGDNLIAILSKVKSYGLTTSLDLALPDPDTAAGRADWRSILKGALPFTDIFLPSIDELLFMIRRTDYDKWVTEDRSDFLMEHGTKLLTSLSDELLEMGCAVVVIKLGGHGLYLRTTGDIQRLRSTGIYTEQQLVEWCQRELYIPCYEVNVEGTTGAGDCTIAGFLSGLLRQLSPEGTMRSAVGVGACNVQKPDAISGIVSWDEVQRHTNEWLPVDVSIPLLGWSLIADSHIWSGTKDS